MMRFAPSAMIVVTCAVGTSTRLWPFRTGMRFKYSGCAGEGGFASAARRRADSTRGSCGFEPAICRTPRAATRTALQIELSDSSRSGFGSPQRFLPQTSKPETKLDLICARLNKMRSAKRRQKVVQRFLVRHIYNRELQLDSILSARHEQIVG